MGDRKRKFSHAEDLDSAAALTLLEGLVEGLRRGELRLEHGEHGLILRPNGSIAMALEARHKPQRESLTLSLSWEPAPHEPVFRIGTGAQTRVLEPESEPEPDAEAGQPPEPGEAPPDPSATGDQAFEVDEATLAALPRDRLYALARAVELDGRSQLSKRALARALTDYELGELLSPAERAQVRIK